MGYFICYFFFNLIYCYGSHLKYLSPYVIFQVWDACSDAMISFSSSEMMDDDVAYIVENDVLLHAINSELSATNNKNLTINYKSKISGYTLQQEDTDQKNVVKMGNGDTYTCKLLVSERKYYIHILLRIR